jgi:hypothetical protein
MTPAIHFRNSLLSEGVLKCSSTHFLVASLLSVQSNLHAILNFHVRGVSELDILLTLCLPANFGVVAFFDFFSRGERSSIYIFSSFTSGAAPNFVLTIDVKYRNHYKYRERSPLFQTQNLHLVKAPLTLWKGGYFKVVGARSSLSLHLTPMYIQVVDGILSDPVLFY